MSFTAQYRGRCIGCDCLIEPGDEVTYPEGHRDVVHADCLDVAPPPPPPRPESICPTCWLTQPCDCAEEL